ncbi:hypothetical protein [Streptomyces sedi]|uniref:Uncharacterized protein n=1 Tax=Streptomyces sedi TaxID=555059 RepID=A0A5C4UTU9_9ACTN|nr:hypothetical protein [Streptomyces sedi]TNM27081.1 hypothetical protein FH715_22270 [Streptomyces sedi]
MSARPTAPVFPRTWGRTDLPVPYATAWSEEKASVGKALISNRSGTGLAYRDEVPTDRDRHGVLWARMTEAPGEGRPNFSTLHSFRQRRSMFDMLCQVCGEPASRTSRGILFLLPHPAGEKKTSDWAEGALSTKPPLCEPCADLATRHCPHLADPLFVRSRKPRIWGVFGGFLTPTANGLRSSPTNDYIPYGHAAAAWFLASQLVIELTRCQVVR